MERVTSARWYPRVRSILLTVNLLILLLPLGGIAGLRLYENELIRRTESELIAQGAFVKAAWREALLRELAKDPEAPPPHRYGEVIAAEYADAEPAEPLKPILPRLDLASDEVRPPAEAAVLTVQTPERWPVAAGEQIQPMMLAARNTTLAGIRVVDHRGVVVATTRSEYGQSLAHREEVQRALRGEHVTMMRARVSDEPAPAIESISRGTRVRVFVALPVVEGDRVLGAVVLSRTPLDVSKALWLIRRELGIGLLTLLAVVGVVSLLTSFTISRPMQRLVEQTGRVAAGDMSAATPLSQPGTHEVGQLSEAFVRMARALAERADYIQTFASNVSHEFKTPLTSIRGTLELIGDHFDGMSAEERARFLGILEQDTERLERLVRRLTELARADVMKPAAESASPGAIARPLVERFAMEGLDVVVRIEDERRVQMGRATLESIVSNLVDNARQHGGAGVHVEVEVREAGPEQVELRVRDTGPGISEANQARVFERFFTTARDRGGSGLGLSIVRALVEAHRGEVGLTSAVGQGTEVVVRLPVATEA